MRVALLQTKSTPRGVHLLTSFARGVELHGDSVVWIKPGDDTCLFDNIDVGVQVCSPNQHDSDSVIGRFRLQSNKALTGTGRRVITIDTGFVRNQSDAERLNRFDVDSPATYSKSDSGIWYSVGFGAVKGEGDYCVAEVPGDRWEAVKTPIRPWRKTGRHILMIGQPLHGLSSQHLNIYGWYRDTVQAIRRYTSREIVYRPHPRLHRASARYKADLARVKKALREVSAAGYSVSSHTNLNDDMTGAWATVVLTSNAAVSSVLYGLPVITSDHRCMAHPVAGHSIAQIEKPPTPDRTSWAHRLAYSQWTCPEMAAGLPWARLRPFATRATS